MCTLVLTGSRSCKDPEVMRAGIAAACRALKLYHPDLPETHAYPKITRVIGGGAKGADSFAPALAELLKAKYEEFPAKWDDLDVPGALIRRNSYGKLYNARAGFARNITMADQADFGLALWDGQSRGTKHMIDQLQQRGKPTFIHRV